MNVTGSNLTLIESNGALLADEYVLNTIYPFHACYNLSVGKKVGLIGFLL